MNVFLQSAALIATSAVTIGSLAYWCGRRRSILAFLSGVTLLWVVAGCALGYYSHLASLTPNRIPEWRHMLASFLAISPLVLLPAAFGVAAVHGVVAMRRIPVLVTLAAISALPMTAWTALASTCYVAFDCP